MPKKSPGLILARRENELFVIELPEELGGHKIVIGCVMIDRNQAKISVRCPREWNIYRGEIRDEYLDNYPF